MSTKSAAAALLLFAISLFSCHAKTADNYKLQEFDKVIEDLMNLCSAPGAQLAVASQGRLKYFKAFGLADTETAQAMTTDHVLRYNSVSKVITGTAILKLVQEGKLSLKDKPFLMFNNLPPPEGAITDERIFNITVKDLLQHSGGWNRTSTGIDLFLGSLYVSQSLDVSRPTPNDVIRLLKGISLDFDPATAVEYSNFGYIVLGRMIARIAGLSYGDYVQKFVLEPVGISGIKLGKTKLKDLASNEARYYGTDGRDSPFVSAFRGEGFVNTSYGYIDYENGAAAGGWIGNAADLVRLIDHIDGLREPRILNKEMAYEMVNAKRPSNMGSTTGNPLWGQPRGLDVFVSVDDDGETVKSFQHDGGAPGARSLFMRFTKLNVTFALLLNTLPSASAFDEWAAGNLTRVAMNIRSWPDYDLFQH